MCVAGERAGGCARMRWAEATHALPRRRLAPRVRRRGGATPNAHAALGAEETTSSAPCSAPRSAPRSAHCTAQQQCGEIAAGEPAIGHKLRVCSATRHEFHIEYTDGGQQYLSQQVSECIYVHVHRELSIEKSVVSFLRATIAKQIKQALEIDAQGLMCRGDNTDIAVVARSSQQ